MLFHGEAEVSANREEAFRSQIQPIIRFSHFLASLPYFWFCGSQWLLLLCQDWKRDEGFEWEDKECDLPPGPSLSWTLLGWKCHSWQMVILELVMPRWKSIAFLMSSFSGLGGSNPVSPTSITVITVNPAGTSSGSGITFCLQLWPRPLGTAVISSQRGISGQEEFLGPQVSPPGSPHHKVSVAY